MWWFNVLYMALMLYEYYSSPYGIHSPLDKFEGPKISPWYAITYYNDYIPSQISKLPSLSLSLSHTHTHTHSFYLLRDPSPPLSPFIPFSPSHKPPPPLSLSLALSPSLPRSLFLHPPPYSFLPLSLSLYVYVLLMFLFTT